MTRQVLRLAAVGAAVAVGLTGFTEARAGEPAPAARVWVTTVDGAELMHERAPVAFGRPVAGNPNVTVTVDPSREFQTMDGFGASITDSSAAVLYRLSPAERDKAMRALFDPAKGDGVSFLRQPIGSSDFTAAGSHYSLDDVPAGERDFALRHFSIARDQERVLPLLRRAKQLNPQLKIMATPWSPPAWMKTNGSLVGGALIDDPAIYQAYARYLVRFVLAYAADGVPVDYLTVQNEPQNGGEHGYPTTAMRVAQETKVIEALGPLLRIASPRTKIIGYDHNWATHPNDVANVPPGQDPETDYPYQLLSGPAGRWLAGTAYHCYYGDPAAQSALHDAFPAKGIWFTECSGSHGPSDPPAQFFRDTLKWHARTIAIGTTRNWAKSVVNWNIALDATGGPHLGGCDTCTGLITVQPDGTFTTNAEYYTIGHLSRFVKPGAVRIASTSFGTTGWNGQIMDVAFRNPDGSTALVVHNENDDPRTFTVAAGGRTFDYTLPGGSLATFTWPRSRVLDDGPRLLPLRGATATSLPANPDAKLAVDEDASTRWSAGQAQEPGQYLQVDLGEQRRFRRVAIDSGGSVGDYARAWQLSVSDDGASWRVLASGTGTGQLTNVDVKARARYLRVTNTGTSGSWWSLADLRLYA
ncbi:discoidin domain-containing protein [Dactylosporangium aurantiacum]|uniref:Discoidin domain-containing protein n=1 Tax=Dactylosporangium aurantiacum TaxID=35754 RepID=A0A9Q9MGM1_9ACTN|nr:discoidin domain-containing protein [Dactylosporangium aurantiacum]MDG6104698.1 discoidin domain-containing protein [Dactylosporangium aurantiacum]UWZ55734.1 discoidin domain-containing protein [Dactylosporangium aurantiacum]